VTKRGGEPCLSHPNSGEGDVSDWTNVDQRFASPILVAATASRMSHRSAGLQEAEMLHALFEKGDSLVEENVM
jgi:hypothetical protein